MKKIITLIAITLIALGVSAQKSKSKTSTSTTFTINPATSSVKWLGKKVGGQHSGKINIQKGTITINDKTISGSIVIDMNTISCDDIKDPKSNKDLVGHLTNEDFFNTAAHPLATMDIVSAEAKGKGTYNVKVNLTIKGISNEVSFVATTKAVGNKMTANAKFAFDRTKYDVKYGSTLFGAAADKAIENDVMLEISISASK